jgi:hypothetical protein
MYSAKTQSLSPTVVVVLWSSAMPADYLGGASHTTESVEMLTATRALAR